MRVNSPPTTPKRNYKPLPQKPPPPPTRFIEDTRSEPRSEPSAYGCSVCGYVYSPDVYACPNCGASSWKESRDRSDNRIKEVHKVSREYEKKLRNKLWRKFWSFFIEV